MDQQSGRGFPKDWYTVSHCTVQTVVYKCSNY